MQTTTKTLLKDRQTYLILSRVDYAPNTATDSRAAGVSALTAGNLLARLLFAQIGDRGHRDGR